MFAISNDERTITVIPAVITFPRNNFAALFIAAAPYMGRLPCLNAFINTADAFGPINAMIASELPTRALFKPAFDNWLANIVVINAVPPTLSPEYVANFSDLSKSSPFQRFVASVILKMLSRGNVRFLILFRCK